MTEPRFVHLRLHSEYSVTDGLVRIAPAIHKTLEMGGVALGITDLMNVFGGLRFYTHALSAGLKPILGCDVKIKNNKFPDNPYRMTFYCMNHTGYHSLCVLLTKAFLEGQDPYRGQICDEWLDVPGATDGLIALTGGPKGRLSQLIDTGSERQAGGIVGRWKKLFPNRLYIELQRANRPKDENQNAFLVTVASRFDVPVVATHPVQFLEPQDFEAHEVRCCIAGGFTITDPRRDKSYTREQYLKSEEQMCELFKDVPSALANSVIIAKRCNLDGVLSKPQLPLFPTPDGMSLDDYMDHLSREGLEKRLAFLYDDEKVRDAKRPEYVERLDYELGIIKKMQFPGYFLIVQDFINWSKTHGVPVGPGRGSGAGSLVAYSLGITDLDPLKFDLLFERFLNPERVSMPDFDVDFCQYNRDRTIEYVKETYGADAVSQIATFGTLGAKAVVRDVARVLNIPFLKADRLAKLIPMQPGKNVTLDDAIKEVPEFREAIESDDEYKELMRVAKGLEGITRNLGMHAGGVLIAPGALTDFCPLYNSDGAPENTISQFDKKDVENVGLVKFDFLGLTTLSILAKCKEYIDKLYPEREFELERIPVTDEETYHCFQNANTAAVFQFESEGMRQLLRQARPDRLEDLVALNALYRPGPMDLIPSFIARKFGREKVEYLDERMAPVLSETYGIMVYQEQVMLLSRLLADFTRGESDALRKAMGKKLRDKLDHMKPKFVEGGRKNGHDPKVLEKIWGDWEKFASYAFNKSHATCYSWVAYQTAYLKANYPAEYMAAVMSRSLSNITDITKLMDECKSMGIKVLGPDVNESNLKFTVNPEGNIRFGLGAVKGVGEGAVLNIMEERAKNGPFKGIFDFVQRVNLTACNKKNLECLALAGGFDEFPELRREQYFAVNSKNEVFLETLVRYGNRYQADQAAAANSLFGGDNVVDIATPEIPEAERWSDLDRLNKERDLVGIYLSAHPLDEYSVVLQHVCNTRMAELEDKTALAGREITMGGIVTSVRRGISKNGNPYGIAKIEDYSGSAELPFFGNDWVTYQGYLGERTFLFIKARCQPKQWKQDELEVKITSMELLPDVKEKLISKITILIPLSVLNQALVTELAALMKGNPGTTELYFKVSDPDSKTVVDMISRPVKLSVGRELISYLNDRPELEFRIN